MNYYNTHSTNGSTDSVEARARKDTTPAPARRGNAAVDSSPSTGWRETARQMGVTPGRQTCDTGACDERGHRVRVLDGSGRLVREVAR